MYLVLQIIHLLLLIDLVFLILILLSLKLVRFKYEFLVNFDTDPTATNVIVDSEPIKVEAWASELRALPAENFTSHSKFS